jgi:hypothetical protein
MLLLDQKQRSKKQQQRRQQQLAVWTVEAGTGIKGVGKL